MSRPSSAAPRASRASGLAPDNSPYGANASGSFAPPRGSYASGLAPYAQHGNASGAFAGPSGSVYNNSVALSRPQSRHEPPPLGATQGPMPGTIERPISGPKKRLIMTCDGTWLNADNGIMNGHKQPPSNVSRIGWAIKQTSRDGIPQIVNYQAGVGTNGGAVAKVVGGATGQGLKENVREAYTYIATNWREGDEIFLIGFSRGAFTARSVGGIIGQLGLLTRKGLPFFNEIFEDLEHQDDNHYMSKYDDIPFPNKGPFNKRYVAELERLGMTRQNINIKAICCFDTVGSLGIPTTPLTSMFATGRQMKQYQFLDTSLHPCIENAFQALALDEHRAAFSPALWEKRRDNTRTNLKQVWFPGVHSNIGGGYDDQEVANLTLAWMMSRLEPFVDFRPDFLISQHEANVNYYRSSGQKPRWWSFGELYRSFSGIYALGGSKTRTPGSYHRTDAQTGKPLEKKLTNTNEYIHASVRTRVGLQGPGTEDKGIYEPKALRDWTFEAEPAPGPGSGGNMANGGLVVWHYHGSDDSSDGQTRIPEAVLLETELALLRQCPRVEEFIRTGAKTKSSRRRRGEGRNGGGGVSGNENGNGNVHGAGSRRRGGSVPPTPSEGVGDSNDDRDRRRRRRKSGDPRDGERRERRRRRRDEEDDY